MKRSALLLALSLAAASCRHDPPLCQTAAGFYAREHGLGPVSITCARGDQAPCVMSYSDTDTGETSQSVSLLCGSMGCTCIGKCPP